MIHINLLPVRAAKKREFGRQQLILFALLIVIAGVGNWFWYRAVEDNLRQVNDQIARSRAEIAQLEKTIGEVKSITQDKKALEDKLKVLDTLKKARTGPVKVLDELSTLIPVRVWLTSWEEQNGLVSMRGQAVNYEDFSSFAAKLKTSKYFRDITIRKVSQKSESSAVDWEITCGANYSA
jgi:type IV pilus assembly protein PilN